MIEWNKYEMDIAKEIINIGLAKAADSLSFFTKEKVLISSLNIELKPLKEFSYPKDNKKQNFHVLTTEIKGDVDGACFLNFTQEAALSFWESALPSDVLEDVNKKIEMGKAILMEADNIITASVVTQFANLLGVRMYGFVPIYKQVNYKEMVKYMLSYAGDADVYLQFSAEFCSQKKSICPDFFWMLNAEFMNKVQEFIKHEGNLLKLKNMKSKNELS